MLSRYHQKAPTSWTALNTAFLFFVIGFLVGYILYGAAMHIVKVEDDFHEMEELKVRAEAADVAKSQVLYPTFSKTLFIPKCHVSDLLSFSFLMSVSCYCFS